MQYGITYMFLFSAGSAYIEGDGFGLRISLYAKRCFRLLFACKFIVVSDIFHK